MIVIVDYGMGNLGSIKNMLSYLKKDSIITSDLSVIRKAKKLILSGVGAFDNGMKNLQENDLSKLLTYKVINEKTPILGICLGMQLLTDKSEEGIEHGLGWIPGETKRFNFKNENKTLKIPHMGWNTVNPKKNSLLLSDMYEEPRFYFVHSFYVATAYQEDTLCETNYGFIFTSAIEKGNIFGVQFHPEKSHKFGMKILNNFAELV